MFYLGLENQINLLVILIFSSYIYLSSLGLKQDTAFTKHIGTAFFIPSILCILSFLSLNAELSSSYIFFAEFILITALLFILLVEKNSDFTNIVFLLLYVLPLGIIILNLNFNSLNRSPVFGFILTFYIGVMFLTIMISLFIKKYSRMTLYSGILMICASLVPAYINLKGIAIPAVLVLKTIGYIQLLIFFNRSTIRKLEEAHSRNTARLDRINQSLQREVNRRVEEIERSNRKLVEISKTDSLTGIYTKKAILDIMDSMIQKNPEREFSILMFDIDNFKNINDTQGHIVGDKCIKNLVSITRSSLRGDDKLGRYGGDEFIIILPETSPVKAYLAAERFRKNIEKTNNPNITISVGVASYPLDASGSRALINAADKALYHSKERGRNTVTHTSQAKE